MAWHSCQAGVVGVLEKWVPSEAPELQVAFDMSDVCMCMSSSYGYHVCFLRSSSTLEKK